MYDFNPEKDIEFTRIIQARPDTVWRCWTEPELLMQWFCPLPWKVTRATLDLRPGGRFYTRFEGPNGEGPDNDICQMENEGCYLDVEPGKRLVFTDALSEGWRPNAKTFMTAIVTFTPNGDGATEYRALVLHSDAAMRAKHIEMGFHDGWGAAADQLNALAQSLQ